MSLSVRTVPGLICLRGYEHIGIDDFKRSMAEVVENRKVEPYLFQFGKYPRIPTGGFYVYNLTDYDEGRPYVEVKDKDDHDLKEFIKKCHSNVFKDTDKYVFVIDGEGFVDETIMSLPDYDRLFVMFAPYNALKTVPISEAKFYLERRKGPKTTNLRFAQVSP